ncbi:SCO family protein [Myxococcus qinghaiensis]|uniref:SCO family protein n=1 Tax=Myxococcus qinghaiensis TaxID=2906758 RepID=UPI0020A6F0DF|nr:SCO family protein [Myxococcus qinghaiensis]MCP3166800.1 SCO family protein [Myxococcus qinghaiensis]
MASPVVEHPRSRRWTGLLIVGVLALVAALAFPLLRESRARLRARGLPEFGALPTFRLTDQTGRPFSEADLRGAVVVADFIFTRCPTVCPLLTAKMARLQRQAREAGLSSVRFVSFSVDPRYDTPERLAAYANTRNLDTSNWSLLTGELEDVEATVLEGFRVMMGRDADAGDDDFLSIFHGEHFVLVDADGRIRGYYRVLDDSDGLESLQRDLGALVHAAD